MKHVAPNDAKITT